MSFPLGQTTLSTGVRRAGFHCIVHVPGPYIVRKADREKLHENRVRGGGGAGGGGGGLKQFIISIHNRVIYTQVHETCNSLFKRLHIIRFF